MPYRFVSRNLSGGRHEDRLRVVQRGGDLVAVVADGAGGVGNASATAEAVCGAVEEEFLRGAGGPRAWDRFLGALDAQLAGRAEGGLSTAVVVELNGGILRGASVGDSGAWLLGDGARLDLTGDQVRKPLLGNGDARPVAFGPVALERRVLLASDGLWKYAPPTALEAAARKEALEAAADALVECVRLAGVKLQDGVALVLVELTPH